MNEFLENMSDGFFDAFFDYRNVEGGINCEVDDSVPTYYLYYGKVTKKHSNLNDAINDPIFNGHSIKDLFDQLDIEYI